MSFLRVTSSLDARLVHHTGTMIRFRTSQLGALPTADKDCVVIFPDGQRARGRFHLHPRNPYIAGAGVVDWIKSWVPSRQPIDVLVQQVGSGDLVHVKMAAPTGASQLSPVRHRRIVERFADEASRAKTEAQRRKVYERLERDPALRGLLLDTWDHRCQVEGCTITDAYPATLRKHLLDVHHLNHVSAGGPDSPTNVSLICAAHHALIHRGPSPRLTKCSALEARVKVNGIVLTIHRDARSLWS